MSEEVFLDSEGVQVTQSRFVVEGKTYPMQGITSVRMDTKFKKANKIWPIIAIIITGLLLVSAIGALFGGNWKSMGAGLVVVALLYASVNWYRRLKDKTTYSIMLTITSGESQALASQDEDLVDQVLTALNNAIIARG